MRETPAAPRAVTSGASDPSDTESGGSPTDKANLEGIAATLAAETPDVQAHAVDAARAESQAQSGKDVNGESFNPAIHAAGADGAGRLNAKGAWERKRGRKAGGSNAPAQGSPPGAARPSRVGSGEPPPPSKEQIQRASGVGAANLFFVACIVIGGEEWQPQIDAKTGLNEKAMLESVFADYFVATGKSDLPPGWALAAGIGMYAARRFTMPKTLNRITRVKMWVGGKIYAWRMRKRKSTVQPYQKIDGDADPRDRATWAGAGGGNAHEVREPGG